jgi:hypothetical protein
MSAELINRLGVIAYGDNIIADALENLGGALTYSEDRDSHSVRLTVSNGKIEAIVRFYEPNVGWHIHEAFLKIA